MANGAKVTLDRDGCTSAQQSQLCSLILGIKASQFDASIGGGELPADGSVQLAPSCLPGRDLPGHFRDGGQAASQTLAGQHRELTLRHVQPGAVLRGPGPLEAGSNAPGAGKPGSHSRQPAFPQHGWRP